LLDNLP